MTSVTALINNNNPSSVQRFTRKLNRPGYAMTTIQELANAITELDCDNPADVERMQQLAECIAYQAEIGREELAKVVQLLK